MGHIGDDRIIFPVYLQRYKRLHFVGDFYQLGSLDLKELPEEILEGLMINEIDMDPNYIWHLLYKPIFQEPPNVDMFLLNEIEQ